MASQPDTALSGSVIATIIIFASLSFLLLLFFIVKHTYLARRALRARRRQARDPERGFFTSDELHSFLRAIHTAQQQEAGAAADVVFRPALVRVPQRPRSMPVYRADGPLPALPTVRVQPATPEKLGFEVGEDGEGEAEGAASKPGGFLALALRGGRRSR